MQSFRLDSPRMLAVDISGDAVRASTGSMVAYTGQVQFKNAGMGGGDGFMAGLKRRATGESLPLMTCSGSGTVWFAKDAMDVILVELNGDTLKAESEQLLALSDKLTTDVTFAGVRGMSSGQGLFTTIGHRLRHGRAAVGGRAADRAGGEPAVPAGGGQGRVHRQPRAAQPDRRHRRVVAQPHRREPAARRSPCASTARASSTSSPRSADDAVLERSTARSSRSRVDAGPGDPRPARRDARLHRRRHVLAGAHGRRAASGGIAGRMMSGRAGVDDGRPGPGQRHYGFRGLYVTIIELDGSGPLSVEADRLLAHDAALQSTVVFLGQQGGIRGAVRGAVSGQGLFTTQLHGYGTAAVSRTAARSRCPSAGSARSSVDPQAYVAHVGQVNVDIAASVGWRDAVGQGSGEAIQLKCTGNGTVYVQASEQKL